MAYDIFKIEHEVYNKKKANKLVLKIKGLDSSIKKNDEKIRLIKVKINRSKLSKIKHISKKNNLNDEKKENLISNLNDERKDLVIKKTKELRLKSRMLNSKKNNLKLELFNLMSKVVTKNINNYSNLAFNSPVTERCNSRDEMQAESWILLENCIKNFKVNSSYCFYFYYNKSLSRTFYKMFIKTKQNLDKFNDYIIDKKNTKSKSTLGNSNMSMEIIIEVLNLNENEEKILRSRLKKEKKSEFLNKNPEITSGKYYLNLRNLKEKIKKLEENGQL